jgi:hypothetical protein
MYCVSCPRPLRGQMRGGHAPKKIKFLASFSPTNTQYIGIAPRFTQIFPL